MTFTKPVLYHHGMSVCAAKVRMALLEKGVAWEGRYVDIRAGEQLAPDYLALNPKGVVPTLVHGDQVILESTVIAEYSDEAFDGPSLVPGTAAGRARMRQWAKRIDDGLHFPATAALTFAIAGRPGLPKAVGRRAPGMVMVADAKSPNSGALRDMVDATGISVAAVVAALRAFDRVLGDMESALGQNMWLAGEAFSLADIGYAPYITRLDCLQLQWLWADRPAVAQWYERIRGRPSYAPAITDCFDPPEEIDVMATNGRLLAADLQGALV